MIGFMPDGRGKYFDGYWKADVFGNGKGFRLCLGHFFAGNRDPVVDQNLFALVFIQGFIPGKGPGFFWPFLGPGVKRPSRAFLTKRPYSISPCMEPTARSGLPKTGRPKRRVISTAVPGRKVTKRIGFL